MTGEEEVASRRAHLEGLLRNLDSGECEGCSELSWHLFPDEHPAQWCEQRVCPFRGVDEDGRPLPPTQHARRVGEWVRSGTRRLQTFAAFGGASSTDSKTS
jgi:hypothetical protein